MRDSGRVRFGVIITLVLFICLVTAAFWAGSQYQSWLSPDVYGYVGIEPVRRYDPLHPNPDAHPDWTGLAIEQKTQATILTSDTLFASALANSDELRKTAWFKSFKRFADAKQFLKDHFAAVPVADSELIKVYITGVSDPREAKRIIEAIVGVHLDQQNALSVNKTLDRTAQLNDLRSKQEQRIHDLLERQNNLLMHLSVGKVGQPGRSTAVDIEYTSAIEKHTQLLAEMAELEARLEAMKKLKRPDEAVADVQLQLEEAKAGYDANAKQIDQLKSQLGDLAISMSEYLSTVDELTATRAANKEVKDQLDTLASQKGDSQIDWRRHPEANDSE